MEPVSLASPVLASGLYHSAIWEVNTGKLFLEELTSILVKEYFICYKTIVIKHDREHTHMQNKKKQKHKKEEEEEEKERGAECQYSMDTKTRLRRHEEKKFQTYRLKCPE